jgi:hypothetical protein
MTSNLIPVTLLLIALFCSATVSAKVEVQSVQHKTAGQILAVSISDDIAPGDYEVLLKGITGNPGQYAQKIFLLDSIGGSVAEAMKMGRLLREAGFDAIVPASSICQGTCVYLLAAGNAKKIRGHVGIHRPYFPSGDSALADQAGNGTGYSSELYFKQMNIAASLIDDMQAIAPSKMRVLTPKELASYRLN